jgi:hypothetical protein
MQQFLKFIYFDLTLYMFRTTFPSIIRSSGLYIQQQAYVNEVPAVCTYSNRHMSMRYLLYVQSFTPDDGRKGRP